MLKFNNKVLKVNDKWLKSEDIPPLPPLPDLPRATIRLLYRNGVTPTFKYGTGVQISQYPNIWDLTCDYTRDLYRWDYLLEGHTSLLAVIAANPIDSVLGAYYKSMKYMFSGCTSLTSVNLFNTYYTNDVEGMFYGCSSLPYVPLFNTYNITNMAEMFNGCSSLTSVPLFNTWQVTNMKGMFDGCSSLNTVPVFKTSKVTSMIRMFNGCSSLTEVPLFDMSKLLAMSSMFKDCISLTNIPSITTPKVTSWDDLFNGCINVESGALDLYQYMKSIMSSDYGRSHNRTFRNCGSNTQTGSAELAQIPDDWK